MFVQGPLGPGARPALRLTVPVHGTAHKTGRWLLEFFFGSGTATAVAVAKLSVLYISFAGIAR